MNRSSALCSLLGTCLLMGGCPARELQPAAPVSPAGTGADRESEGAQSDTPTPCETGAAPARVCELIERLDASDDIVTVARALEKLGPDAAAAVPALVEHMTHEDADVREDIIEALEAIRSPAAVPALIDALEDEEDDVRAQAANALGEIGDPRAVSALGRALDDPDYTVRWYAIKALKDIGDIAAAPHLERALSDESIRIRRAAFETLRWIGQGSSWELATIPKQLVEDQCRSVAAALGRTKPAKQMEIAVHTFEGGPCGRLTVVAKVTPDMLLAILAKAQGEVPQRCRPFCDDVWDALANAMPEIKRFLVAEACADAYDYDLQRFTIELQLTYLALRHCAEHLDAFEGIALFGGHAMTHNPKQQRVRGIDDLTPGAFAGAFGELTPWADVIKTVSPDGVRVAWPNLLTIRRGEIAWLDEEAGFRFPGKRTTVEAAREGLAEHIELERFDPPLLAVGVGTSLKQLKQALDPSARLVDAPIPVVSRAKCPEDAPAIRPVGEGMYRIRAPGSEVKTVGRDDIAFELGSAPAACLDGFDDYDSLRALARSIRAVASDDRGPDLILHLR